MKKVLIIQTAFIGDVILATPVISELNRLFPSVEIDVLVRKGNESLLANNPYVKNVLILDKKKSKIPELMRLIKIIRNENYDCIINLHRYASSGLITIFGGGKQTIGFDKNPLSLFFSKKAKHSLKEGLHEVERNLSLIKHLGAKNKVRPSLYPSEQDEALVEVYKTKEYFCLAPASVWYTKMLPIEKWIELIGVLSTKGQIYLLGGPGDIELCETILSSSKVKNIENLAGKLSFLASAALMKGATRNYVNDSGPLHICSAMNAPVTAFFCSTITDFGFGPLSEDSKILEVTDLDCRPCGIHGHKTCPQGHFKCGNEIKIN